MKKQFLTWAVAMALGAVAHGQAFTFNQTNSVSGGVIPDNNPSGYADTMTVGSLAGNIQNVTVSLDITGGYNGDLYAYVAGPNGGFAVLLNRVGVNGSSTYGYGDAGFNITLDDSGIDPDIHFYQNDGPSYTGGQLAGTWGSDGENISPLSSPGSFSGIGSANLTTFDGLDATGTWTLFVADLAAGNQSTLVSWELDITTVPEPSTVALGAFGLGLMAIRGFKRIKFARVNGPAA
jgi:subtilisin-like proprotein convertase family protein